MIGNGMRTTGYGNVMTGIQAIMAAHTMEEVIINRNQIYIKAHPTKTIVPAAPFKEEALDLVQAQREDSAVNGSNKGH